jgi:hypothetical protein
MVQANEAAPAQAPYINIPAFSYNPPFESWDCGEVSAPRTSVPATGPKGGYPDYDCPPLNEADLTTTEYRNILKLFCLIFASNDKQSVKSMLEYDNPNYNYQKRLKDIKIGVSGDPSTNLNVDDNERRYWELTRAGKPAFWAARYAANIVGWLWNYRGNTNIKETVVAQPYKTFSMIEFAYVCDAMYIYVIGRNTFRDRRDQYASVHARSMTVATVTQALI